MFDKGLIFRIYKELTNSKSRNSIGKKMAKKQTKKPNPNTHTKKTLNRVFTKENIQMDNKYMKQISIL